MIFDQITIVRALAAIVCQLAAGSIFFRYLDIMSIFVLLVDYQPLAGLRSQLRPHYGK
jgi:hypothetical protein